MKYEILQALREAAPEFVSGEALSRLLGVTRTTVWKCINELRAQNYQIEASSRNGYRLVSGDGQLNGFEVAYRLGTAVIGRKVLYFDFLDSTSNYAKKLALEGCEDGTAVLAGRQTAGRGRIGKGWDSQQNKGLYLSVVLKPEIPPEKIQLLTLAASVAVVDAIHKACGVDTGIKWPNDVILDGKKVCGILTEMNCETDRVNFAVIGIGINLSQTAGDFPEDLRSRAVSLMAHLQDRGVPGRVPGRLDLARAVLSELDRGYALLNADCGSRIVEMWRQRSLTIGREVRVYGKDTQYTGTAVDVTDDGRLVVSCADGAVREVMSGEVSVRGIMDYI
jgi:BirA family biotin operon repressor/biotin-[acetyl-CoA-carboxylase] ligase